jgi:Tat protein secretion system quality control protein TatD with DNase activity
VELSEGSILVETDSPWLAPGAGHRNEPTSVLRVIDGLARLRGTTSDALSGQIGEAYERLLAS